MAATQPRDTIPATCNAYMISLAVSVTAIAESTMHCWNSLLTLVLDTTIGCHGNLCIMKCCSFIDLLLDQIEGVHLSLPEILG